MAPLNASVRQLMRVCVSVMSALLATACAPKQNDPHIPLGSGTYQFQQLDDEFSQSPGFPVTLTIQGTRYTVTTPGALCGGIAAGSVLDAGIILWHRSTNEWILARSEADRNASDVGGCADGPNTIDFKRREIHSCMCGS